MMMIYEPAVLAARPVTANATRPAKAIVHAAPGARVQPLAPIAIIAPRPGAVG